MISGNAATRTGLPPELSICDGAGRVPYFCESERVEYPAYRQLLSIKTASGGQEDYSRRRQVRGRPDVFLSSMKTARTRAA